MQLRPEFEYSNCCFTAFILFNLHLLYHYFSEEKEKASDLSRMGTYFISPATLYGPYLSQHNHPWQKQGRVAGCLWHKRPEPGLDPSHLWEERKNMGVRRGGEAGWGVVERESDSWRDRERDRGWGGQCIWLRWRYRGACVPEVCMYMCVCVFQM